MQLSYISRAICLALCAAGGLQIAFECAAWLMAPLLLRNAKVKDARGTEQAFFRLTLGARLGPWLLALGFLLPAYMQGETNFAAERVGFASLMLAMGLLFWWVFAFLRLFLAVYRTHRCCRLCPEVGRGPGDLPLLLYPGERSVMAVAGLFSDRILLSQSLLDKSRFSAAALQVAFAHEHAHARQRDNLRTLLLALFPHVPLSTKHLPSLSRRWRLAAEMAADEEGTQGKPERSLLLAEMLVTMALEGNQRMPQGIVALCSESEHLRVRVERLLERLDNPSSTETMERPERGKLRLVVAMAAFASTLTALCYACVVLGHRAAELLFRVG